MPRWTLPLGDVYAADKGKDGWHAWVTRKRTGERVCVVRGARWGELRQDLLDRWTSQQDTVEGRNPFYRPSE